MQHFVVRIESPGSRQLAMPKRQELTAMVLAGTLAPTVVWSDETTLVTKFEAGHHWQPPQQLESLAKHLQQLHRLPSEGKLPELDLVRHCNGYWHQRPDIQEQGKFTRGITHLRENLERFPERRFCHVDLNPANILQRQDEFIFLDWEYAAVCSPYFDLASIIEFGGLDEAQTQAFCHYYWGEQYDDKHFKAIAEFQKIVRFVEWLWLRLANID
jgi:thiamine kinase-like enzyme